MRVPSGVRTTVVLICGLFAICQQARAASALTEKDARVLVAMTGSSVDEVTVARLVLGRPADQRMRTFAAMTLRDHNALLASLGATARAKGLALSTGLDADGVRLLGQLNAAVGTRFDCLYILSQVEMHQKAVTMLQAELPTLVDADVKTLVQQALPVLQRHLSMAQQLSDAMTTQCRP